MENKFEKALKNNDLESFIVGNGDYMIYDRDYGTHWILGVWQYHIIPFLELKEDKKKYVLEYFKKLLKLVSDNDINLLLNNLYTYYYLLSENNLKENYIIDLNNDILKIIDCYKSKIIEDEDKIKMFNQILSLIHRRNGLLESELI